MVKEGYKGTLMDRAESDTSNLSGSDFMYFLYKKLYERLTFWGVSVIMFLMCDFAQKWKVPQCGVFI